MSNVEWDGIPNCRSCISKGFTTNSRAGYGEMHVCESRLTCIAKKRGGLVIGDYQGLRRES